jgi:S-phase kinase-associated protein 1
MLDDLGLPEDKTETIPLPNVRSDILRLVVAWCIQHKDEPPMPEEDDGRERRTDDIPLWDQTFLQVDQPVLFDLILVIILAFYIECKNDIFNGIYLS